MAGKKPTRPLIAELSEVECKRGHKGQWVMGNTTRQCRECLRSATLTHRVKAGMYLGPENRAKAMTRIEQDLEKTRQEIENAKQRYEILKQIAELKQQLTQLR